MKNLKGTKTEENLKTAYKGESEARNKYTYFASKAKKDGYVQISEIFEQTANNEKEHAKLWFKLIEGINKTDKNLQNSMQNEDYEARVMYPNFAKEAREEGFDDIAKMFKEVAEVESEHRDRYMALLKNIEKDTVFNDTKEVEWHCLNCGYVHKGKTAPEVCPACAHGREYFERYPKNY